MALVQTNTQAPSNVSAADGAQPVILGGKQGELITTELHGKYYTQTYRGNVFIGTQAAAGAAVPVYSNTTQQCGIFNPSGSSVNVIPIKLNIGYVSTTGAAGAFAIGYIKNAGAQVATGSPGITAATTLAPVNANIMGQSSKVIFMSSAITTAAPALLMQIGVNQLVTTATVATIGFFEGKYEFDGHVMVPPGTAIFVCGNIALLAVCSCSIVWEEVPV